jgi:adenosylhomocysteine nucleosidase
MMKNSTIELERCNMLAIIGAMDEEVNAIKSLMVNIQIENIGPIVFYHGRLNDKEIILFKSGIGLSMASMSTSLCLSHYKIDGVINIGTAGGLKDNQNVLDIVVSDKITYHDFDITPFGNTRDFSSNNRYVFTSDSNYIDLFKSLNHKHPVWIGPMVSGNQFIHSEEQIDTIVKFFPEALAVEMEGAAIAHVCNTFNCPFIVIRSISDLVRNPKNNMTFNEYLLKASERSAQFCFDFVKLT